jgi:DNA primase
MIAPQTIESVKSLSIVDVVSKYVPELKKSGSSWRAPSPFTDEKTPSFYVVPNRNFFKCFSSGKGGDLITFVIEKFGLSYVDAIKTLCSDFNITIEYESEGLTKEHYDRQATLLKINHATANHYRNELLKIFAWPMPDFLLDIDAWYVQVFNELITRRKFTLDTINQWQIGYAPGDVGEGYTPAKWRFLAEKMISTGNHEHGQHLGLITTKDQVNYDTFRHRIIYPIIDEKSQYRGFGGRALKEDNFNPKYINSTNSDVFDKSKVLYGLHYAADAIRKQQYANLMEGYTDVISFHQAGILNTVGTCGTALTEDQCKLLRKYTQRVVLFVEDAAGENAAMNVIDLLMQHGFLTTVVPLPAMIELKYAPREERPGPYQLPWEGPQPVFITHREKETLLVRSQRGELTLHIESDIKSQSKIDPDELVRMLSA